MTVAVTDLGTGPATTAGPASGPHPADCPREAFVTEVVAAARAAAPGRPSRDIAALLRQLADDSAHATDTPPGPDTAWLYTRAATVLENADA